MNGVDALVRCIAEITADSLLTTHEVRDNEMNGVLEWLCGTV